MNCNCITGQLVKCSKEKLWEIFRNMKYEDTITIETKLPTCGCTSTDCFDYGTRKLFQGKKTEMVEIETYYCEKKGDFVYEERKPGLDFYYRNESWHEDEKKWETNLLGETIIFRLQFNETKNTVKISHYGHGDYGWGDCDRYVKTKLEEEKSLLTKFLTFK